MHIFDCTLRDGANVVGNGFSETLTTAIIDGLLACGITEIEMGNAKGLGAYDALGAKAPLTDDGYMQIAARYNGRAHLGMFMLASLCQEKILQSAANGGLSFIRVGNAAGHGQESLGAVRLVRQAGLTCRYSLMKAYLSSSTALAEEARMLADSGVESITIMDSAGTMLPAEVSEYVHALRSKISIPVGFHGHNNMGLSQANALAAIQAGVDEIDCGLLGMARSAGNCSTEATVALLRKTGLLHNIDFFKLLDFLNDILIPAMASYKYSPALTPDDLILGVTGCHSGNLPLIRAVAETEHVPLYPLVEAVSAADRNAPSQEFIIEIARKLKNI